MAGVRQFENSHPRARVPLGRSDKHARDGARTGIVVGRPDGGNRFLANGDDPEFLDLLTEAKEPIGQRVYVRSSGSGDRVTTPRRVRTPGARSPRRGRGR